MMDNVAISSRQNVDVLLGAVGEQLVARGEHYSIVVVGGSALMALGLVSRGTRDVDVVALLQDGELVSAEPLPEGLIKAAEVVAADFAIPVDWLNAGPASLMDFGLPDGFLERVECRGYGPALEVRFASRLDQIHLKLYAVVDQGAGQHLADLQALHPTVEELRAAARWSETQDTSVGYREVLLRVLDYLGVPGGPPRA